MSTYYFLVCDDHKEITDAASRSMSGPCHLANSDKTLIPFIITHHGCKVRIVSEHESELDSDEFKEWTPSEIEALYLTPRPLSDSVRAHNPEGE